MTKKLLIQLPIHPQQAAAWLAIDENGNQISEFDKTIFEQCDTVVTVPGSEVFLTTVKLPKLSGAQLTKAIPFALNEQLAEDATKLHFAVGSANKDGDIPVCVVTKEKMRLWQQQLASTFKNMRLNLKKLLPEILLIPWQTNDWTVMIDNNIALVRTGTYSGFEIEISELWPLLRIMLQKSDANKPHTLVFIGDLSIPMEEVAFLKENKISIQIYPPKKLLPVMMDNIERAPALNLWQGEFNVAQRTKSQRASLIITASLAGLWLFVLTLGMIIQLASLSHQEKILNQTIVSYAKKAFPQNKVVSRREIKNLVQTALGSGASKNNFLVLMNRIAPLLSKAVEIKVLSLEYSNYQLTLAVETNDFAKLDNLRQALNKANTKSELREAIKTGSQIKASLVINSGTKEKS